MNKIEGALQEIIKILQDHMAFEHIYTDCGGDFNLTECSNCNSFTKCFKSYSLYNRLLNLLKILTK